METDLNFFEEVHLGRHSSSRKVVRAYPQTFKAGMLIGGISIILILAIVGFQTGGNSPNFEEAALQLDSIQIQQNNRIIELLEAGAVRDTTIIHIVAPVL